MKTKIALVLFSAVATTGFTEQSCCECDWGVGVHADFLWWRAQGDQLDYGIVTQGTIDRSGVPILDTLAEQWLEYTPRWNPGARVGVEKSLCEGLGLLAEWTWYQTEDQQRETFITPGNDESFLIFTSDFIGSAGGSTVNSLTAFEAARVDARFLFLLNRVDFGFYKEFCSCDALLFRTYAAFTYAHVRENMQLQGTFVNPTTSYFSSRSYRTKTKIDGYGIVLGAIGDWGFLPCFSLFTKASLTGLWGDFTLHRTFTESVGGTISALDFATRFGYDRWQGRFLTQLQAALKYSAWFCGCYELIVQVGWEHQVIFDQTNWMVRSGQLIANASKPAANLYIQGLVAQLGFFF